MSEYPRHFAKITPEKAAVMMFPSGETLSYARLEHEANQFAQLLRSLGLRPGDKVALKLPNCLEIFPFVWGAQRAGMLHISISNSLTHDEVAYILKDSGTQLFLTTEQGNTDLMLALAQEFSRKIKLLSVSDPLEGWEKWRDALAEHSSQPISDECWGTDMLYSSGTTGFPKGIVTEIDPQVPVDKPPTMAVLGKAFFGMNSDTVYLNPAPLYHAAPLRFCMATHFLGGTVISLGKFDAEDTLRAIETHKTSMSQFVPTHFNRLLDLPEEVRNSYDVSSLTSAVHAAAPCSIETKKKMIDWWGPIIDEYYGGSEGVGMTFCKCADWLTHQGSVGKEIFGQVRICDENGELLPDGSEGLIYFSDGDTFAYHNDPEKTAASHNALGWATLGDVGRLDEDGFLYLTDRKSFMIISGGVNIYPQEIEHLLSDHPLVRDVAVIGTPHHDLGEQVTAVIELYDQSKVDDQTRKMLTDFMREKLSGIKVPKQIDFIEHMPRTETGKLLKRKVRDEYWKEVAV